MSTTIGSFVPLETVHQGSCWKRRMLFSPSIHVQEQRTVTGDLVAGKEFRTSNAQWQRLGPERWAHRSRHLCSFTTTPPPFVIPTRDDPPDQPHFFPTQQQDWDFWCKHRDLVFQGKGLHPAAPMWERVHALAEDIWTFRFNIQKPGGNDFSRECPWSHPTPTLMYGSWCAGCAPALIALCATLGVPARVVQVLDHAMVEAWIDGAWCLIDNVTSLAKAGGNMMLRGGLAEVLLDPTNPQWGFTDEQKGKYWEKTFLMYSSSTGRHHEEPFITHLTPQNALALYPGWVNPRFKSHQPDTYDLVWGRPAWSHPALILKQGQAFRRRFWLGSLAETRRILVTLCGERGSGDAAYAPHHVPTDGGDWFIAVNGRRFSLRDLGGWQFADGKQPQDWILDLRWTRTFDVPLDALVESEWNEIAVGCPGSGEQFLRFGGSADWILPEEHCLCPRVTHER